MKDGEYVFQYRIGVYYKDFKWARNLLDEYIKSIPPECIDHHMKNRLVLKNGSCINLVPANTNCRGQRYDRVIVQEGIDKKILDCIIRPAMLNEIITPLER